MNILLLGGTGAMGVHLSSILGLRGEDVYVTTRGNKKGEGTIKYLKGNAKNIDFLQTVLQMKKWDAIVDFMVYNTKELQERIDLLLSATKQYVFLSSSRVYAESPSGIITEESPRLLDVSKDKEYLLTDEYALAKAREENILYTSLSKNWTIIRPYITFSEQRLQLGVMEKEDWLCRVLNGGSIVFSEDIAQHITTMTYGYDVAKGIAGIIGKEKALGEAFHIVTSEYYKWSEILDIYLNVIEEELGFRPKVVFTKQAINLRFKKLQYQVKYCRLFDRRFDNSKILSIVPDLEFTSVKDSLRSCCKDLIESGNFKNSNNNFLYALMDKEAKEYISFRKYNGIKNKIKYIVFRFSFSTLVNRLINR
ncbi:MAG: epimerase [Paludibacteraceae bacterium]|nr:epimerase [Paludibacteraceae bacterium]